ncbi:MAG TPA: thioredoxin family protein, partial [Pseudomonas sp.]|nr:thioredoxin family protein [Pseudomonas sp.]
MSNIDSHPVVSRAEWLSARLQHLDHEKELTRQRDRVSAERRALPWVRIDKPYTFNGPDGQQTLAELFGKNSQLIVYHFMFAKGWKEGCKGCSFLSDHLDGANLHLAHHDISLVAVSHAPLQEFQDFKKRMGWHFRWVSSAGTDFNEDFHVSATDKERTAGKMEYNYETMDLAEQEMPGVSVFYKNDAGEIFHTYSAY